MATRVKASGIYDKALKMYKTSESLEALSMEYGRIRAFTPGWLERESVFLHMEYKYLLGLLKAGLDLSPLITHRLGYADYREGFEAMKSGQSGKVVLDWDKAA